MSGLSPDSIANLLSKQFGLSFSGSTENLDGGTYAVIRPDDLPKPNGFGIAIARTPRLIEASFHPDSFSGSLLRQMCESGEESFRTFSRLYATAEQSAIRISFLVNGVPKTDLSNSDADELWRKFELDCDLRLPANIKSHPELVEEYASKIASTCMSLVLSLIPVEEVTDSVSGFEPGLPEGAKIKVEINKYERNPINRAACIAHYGPKCRVCGLEFGDFYGEHGKDFIEVHHLIPVSQMGGSYNIDPINDLAPVCSNCHSMLHRENPPLSIEVLKKIIAESNSR
jgi:5-methylcytosine-specific restriction protein A